jgi:hypothetical protein
VLATVLTLLALPGPAAAQGADPAAATGLPEATAQRMIPWGSLPDTVRTALDRLRQRGDLGAVGATDSILVGPARIALGDTVRGALLVHGGSLELEGTVLGPVAVVGGDLIIGDGARVEGSASAVAGTVRVAGGEVTGDIRSTSADPASAATAMDALDPGSVEVMPANSTVSTWRAMKLVTATFALFLILGVGILVFAQPTLDSVVRALEDRFARAFWTGLLAQFAILPLLLLLVTALTISLVGILLIPFAIVAYVIATAGLLALGFLAAARLTGSAFGGAGAESARSADLRGILMGLLVYFVLWLLAAGMSWHPLGGTVLRAIAVGVTWVAATLGLGAIISAGLGARRARAEAHLPRSATDPMAWQTPTPITGVAAARRPLSPTRHA